MQVSVKYCKIEVYMIFIMLSANICSSQNLESYKISGIKKIDSTLMSVENSKKLKLLSLLPSVGYNRSTGVNISVSLSPFIRYVQQKRRNSIEIERLRNNQIEKLDNEIISIEDRIFQLEVDITIAQANAGNLELLHQLYVIDSLSSVNNELPYGEWIQAKYNYSNAWQSHYKSYLSINAKKAFMTRKYGFPLTSLSLELTLLLDKLNALKP